MKWSSRDGYPNLTLKWSFFSRQCLLEYTQHTGSECRGACLGSQGAVVWRMTDPPWVLNTKTWRRLLRNLNKRRHHKSIIQVTWEWSPDESQSGGRWKPLVLAAGSSFCESNVIKYYRAVFWTVWGCPRQSHRWQYWEQPLSGTFLVTMMGHLTKSV